MHLPLLTTLLLLPLALASWPEWPSAHGSGSHEAPAAVVKRATTTTTASTNHANAGVRRAIEHGRAQVPADGGTNPHARRSPGEPTNDARPPPPPFEKAVTRPAHGITPHLLAKVKLHPSGQQGTGAKQQGGGIVVETKDGYVQKGGGEQVDRRALLERLEARVLLNRELYVRDVLQGLARRGMVGEVAERGWEDELAERGFEDLDGHDDLWY